MCQLITVLPLFGILLIGAQVPQDKLQLRENRKAMKREILKHIPIGTEIEAAQTTMERNGFKCVRKNNGTFTEREPKGLVGAPHGSLDFLYCDLEVPATEYCARRYQIAIVHKNGIVSEVLVSIGLICT